MTEVVFLSLLISSLGFEAVLISSWIYSEHSTVKQQIEEEEILTSYEPANKKASAPLQPNGHSDQKQVDDSALSEWEYKIVRANRDLFRNPAIFHKLCEEEAEMGWMMLEKLDDRRVRFKRLANLPDQNNDELPRFDPYRSHYGSDLDFTSWLAAIAFMTAIVLPAYLGYALVSATLNNLPNSLPRIPLLNQPPEVETEVENNQQPPEEIPSELEAKPSGT
ncbi:MAG: hypothetical protein WAN66_05775 [Limnoraphis robusta]|uniref:hypothetical protein n=1 Tax=Limnoraphis robusta TaxID=1118279 RepID=UPI002B1FF983|nr:hypothetical protein [Limnoraphis robusta]MEA5501349.1 hypothetical protein [Limnoraphis robusta BA-68 BA1]